MEQKPITIKVDCEGVDETMQKVVSLIEKMQEVKTLADEITTCISDLNLKIEL